MYQRRCMIWTMVSVILLPFMSYSVIYLRRCVILLPSWVTVLCIREDVLYCCLHELQCYVSEKMCDIVAFHELQCYVSEKMCYIVAFHELQCYVSEKMCDIVAFHELQCYLSEKMCYIVAFMSYSVMYQRRCVILLPSWVTVLCIREDVWYCCLSWVTVLCIREDVWYCCLSWVTVLCIREYVPVGVGQCVLWASSVACAEGCWPQNAPSSRNWPLSIPFDHLLPDTVHPLPSSEG